MTERFVSARSLDEALSVLAADSSARAIAGGTDLVVAARQGRKALPETIVAIDRIAVLGQRGRDGDALVLGALTTHAWLASDPDVRSRWTGLADAAAIVGSPATRGFGTIGGNLMNASPAAETTAPFVVHDAVATLRGDRGIERRVAVADLAVGPGRTVATAGELLVSVRVPGPPAGSGSAYIRLEYRQAMEIAVVGAAALVTIDADGRIAAARVALTAVAPTIVRCPEAEDVLIDGPAGGDAFRRAGEAAAAASHPIDDVRASADYRRAMLAVVVARTLAAAAARASGREVPVPASRWTPDEVA